MPLLPNVLINTRRPPGTGMHAIDIDAHIRPNIQNGYTILPVAALESDYEVIVDSGTDLVEGDLLASITLPDGTTPWPGLGAVNTHEYFRVSYAYESIPGPLQHRKVFVKRVRGGGIAY